MPLSHAVKDVAERYAVSIPTVLAWISSNELRAVNVARSRGKRPTWRITPEALDAFELIRTPAPAAPRAQRGRKQQRKFYP